MTDIMRLSIAVALLAVAIVILSVAVAISQEVGVASVYGMNKGRGDSSTQRVACGGRLNVGALTAAHRRLPCGTGVRVTNIGNGRSVVVTINDRGPFVRGRIIDLSPAAARAIGLGYGLARVRVERVAP